MTIIHIMLSAFEVVGVLLAAYAVYRLSASPQERRLNQAGRMSDKSSQSHTDAQDKPVVFTGRDFFSIDFD